ncbi:MAG: type II secretion system F family protein [Myxococcota bacterium]
MPDFVWVGKDLAGRKQQGTIKANSIEAAESKLKQQKITITKIRPKGKFDIDLTIGTGIKIRDIVIFARQFSTMVDAGLPIVQALDILASQHENPAFRKILFSVKEEVEGGSTLADALKKHPKVFDDLFCNLVAAGEVGGILDTIMQRLAAYLEKNAKIIKEVKGALTYPVAIIIVAVTISIFLLWKVIPTFAQMFKEAGTALPAPTQIVVDLSDLIVNNIVQVFVGLIAFVFVFRFAINTKVGRVIWDRVLLQLPVLGEMLRKMAIARFTRTLGTMVSSGVPILDALNIVATTAGNKIVERSVFYIREKVSEGKNIAEPMMETKIFPPMVVQMIGVGEATGAMDAMLGKIADFYEDEVDVMVAQFKALLEPMIMVFLGIILGGLVIAMYLPIFNMGKAVG